MIAPAGGPGGPDTGSPPPGPPRPTTPDPRDHDQSPRWPAFLGIAFAVAGMLFALGRSRGWWSW